MGADKVARLLTAGLGRVSAASLAPAQVNGCPALILRIDGEVDDGRITGLYAVRTPEKLSRVERETAVSR